MLRNALLGMGLACATAVHATLDLAQFYTRTVKANQPWAEIDTRMDSLAIRMDINAGVVTTRATLSYTPSKGFTQSQSCANTCPRNVDSLCIDACVYNWVAVETPLDSLETVAYFQLTDNNAIDEMHLWVGNEKVKAAIQDRAAASAQYEDIVKRRKDPALLETYGNGSYTLKIFPNESGQRRKIEIVFVQGLEGDANRTVLPIVQSLQSRIAEGAAYTEAGPKKRIGSITLTATALDGKTYSLDWPGLGSGKIGATPLKMSATEVEELKEGLISGAVPACAGCLSAWTAGNATASYFGVKADLIGSRIDFEPEPGERIVLLDVDPADTLSPDRARKLALLALKAYAVAPNTGNLAMPDGKGGIRYIFPKSVSMDAEHLREALDALTAWKPTAKADARSTLEAFAKDRGTASPPSLALLINNEPFLSVPYPEIYDDVRYAEYLAANQALDASQMPIWNALSATLNGSRVSLFGFWNNYRLNQVAEATGGFCLGGINGWLYGPRRNDITGAAPENALANGAATRQAIAWYLPPLYGPGRPDAYHVENLKLSTSGVAVTDLNLLQEYQYYRYYLMLAKSSVNGQRTLAKSAFAPYPTTSSPESASVRISGRYRDGGRLDMTLTGRWGGLAFTWKSAADLPFGQGTDIRGGSIWAYQRIEAWGRDDEPDDLAAMRKLGKEYAIVSRQTSLLALEPGMDLWPEFPAKPGESATEASSINSKGADFAASGANLDLASLEEILDGSILGVRPVRSGPAGDGAFTVSSANGSVRLSWTPPGNAQTARFLILDADGRTVGDFRAVKNGAAFDGEWRNQGRTGIYFLVGSAGSSTLRRKLAVHP